jgi:DNA-binding MarR family transcriptional regulator
MRMPVAVATQLESAQRLRQAIGKLHRWLRVTDASRAAGLAPARVSALLNVERNGPLRLSRLAEDEGINPTMLSRMVGDLVDAGLLERTSDAEDKRAAWVGVTPAGRELVQQLRRERTAAVDAALATLDPDDAAQIEAALPALERLAERLKQARA